MTDYGIVPNVPAHCIQIFRKHFDEGCTPSPSANYGYFGLFVHVGEFDAKAKDSKEQPVNN